jgi:hypothetical protein
MHKHGQYSEIVCGDDCEFLDKKKEFCNKYKSKLECDIPMFFYKLYQCRNKHEN